MASIDTMTTSKELVLAFQQPGSEQIPGSTILTRLNYYDGKFLRADDLRLEQDYQRYLAELGARGCGSGLIYGFDVSTGDGDLLTVGGGLAFDGNGRVLYMPASFTVSLQSLINLSQRRLQMEPQATAGPDGFQVCADTATQNGTPPPAPSGGEFWKISISHAENACGDEDVFGTLCDDGCATSTDKAYIIEGVVVRATQFLPTHPLPTTTAVQLTEAHLRSQLASAYYADEQDFVPCAISGAGLRSGIWCNGAAAPKGSEVDIAVVGRLSSCTFVDEWMVRRERMETPPRRYWQDRMCARPWDIFLAQVLQFQCQLPCVLACAGPTTVDPCRQQTDVIRGIKAYVDQIVAQQPPQQAPQPVIDEAVAQPAAGAVQPKQALMMQRAATVDVNTLQLELEKVLANVGAPSQHIFIDCGLVELPPAGYIPVTVGNLPPVEDQVRQLMGPGVDLRFCVADADYIPRAFESAQHMRRISLIDGLANGNKPKVDILVPNGLLGTTTTTVSSPAWSVTVQLSMALLRGIFAHAQNEFSFAAVVEKGQLKLQGAGRSAPTASGDEFEAAAFEAGSDLGGEPDTGFAGCVQVSSDKSPLDVAQGEDLSVQVGLAFYEDVGAPFGPELDTQTTLTVIKDFASTGVCRAKGQLDSVPIVVELGGGGDNFTLKVFGGNGTTVLAAGELSRVAGLDPSSGPGQLAEQALEKLSAGLADPTLPDSIKQKLFVDPTTSTGSGGITATLDWVLFHRRRHKDCETSVAPPPPPPPPPPKTIKHLVHFYTTSDEETRKLLEEADADPSAATIDDVLAVANSTNVGDAEFSADGVTLVTSTGTLQQEWSKVAATPPLELVLVASATPVSETEKEALEIAIACGGSSALETTAYKVAPPPGYDAVTFLRGRPRKA